MAGGAVGGVLGSMVGRGKRIIMLASLPPPVLSSTTGIPACSAALTASLTTGAFSSRAAAVYINFFWNSGLPPAAVTAWLKVFSRDWINSSRRLGFKLLASPLTIHSSGTILVAGRGRCFPPFPPAPPMNASALGRTASPPTPVRHRAPCNTAEIPPREEGASPDS